METTIRRNGRTTLGPSASEGSRFLWLHLQAFPGGAVALARTFKVELSTVWRWIYGDRRPPRKRIERLKKMFKIAPDLWFKTARVPYLTDAVF